MKRNFVVIIITLAAGALFVGLVYSVLVATHVSQPAHTTVHGMTAARLWATTTAALAVIAVVMGGLALRRSSNQSAASTVARTGKSTAALLAGSVAVIIGFVNLSVATGGPGSGNGVVGAAVAIVLGLCAMVLGGVARARVRRTG